MVKSAMLALRINPETREALDRAAATEDRSVSYLVERILRAWLEERGFLSQPAQ